MLAPPAAARIDPQATPEPKCHDHNGEVSVHVPKNRRFIDLCAGCGGLSLGLINAGWKGLFAVEKDKRAFATLSHNLLNAESSGFHWPDWLPIRATSLESLLRKHKKQLDDLRGSVDLIAGGPPCQGFSTAGRRVAGDPRNKLFRHYLKLVRLIRPRAVVMENVSGILFPFKQGQPDEKEMHAPVYADVIRKALERTLGYKVGYAIVHSKDYGVPQTRPRFILIGIRKDLCKKAGELDVNELLDELRIGFLTEKNLGLRPVTVSDAIGDLRTSARRLKTCPETPRFKQGRYGAQTSAYQRLMHGSMNGELADSHRLANHFPATVNKFKWFHKHCRKGVTLKPEERGKYKNSKQSFYILSSSAPAPTVTTLPDDILHYREPRILTVREMARLQSFPDWFEFKGKYTTGGEQRVKECPRYTQVGNAVPPLLAEALGRAVDKVLDELPRA